MRSLVAFALGIAVVGVACAADDTPNCLAHSVSHVLVAKQDAAENIVARADGALFWDGDAGIYRRTIYGDVSATPTPGAVKHFAVDDERVYWTDWQGGVRMAYISGGTAFVVAEGTCDVGTCEEQIAVDDQSIYWTHDFGAIVMRAKTSGSPVEIAVPVLPEAPLLVDATNIYWVRIVVDPPNTYSLEAMSKTTFESHSLATFDGWVGPVDIGDSLAIVRHDGLWRIPKDGSGPLLVRAEPLEPLAITSDGVHVYVIESADIRAISLLSGEVTTLTCNAPRGLRSMSIAVDDHDIYWPEQTQDAILAADKAAP